jgi:Flp pilus assembly pilin Flp
MKALRSKQGQGMTEYVIILAAVVALAYVFLNSNFKGPLKSQIGAIGQQLSQPASQ